MSDAKHVPPAGVFACVAAGLATWPLFAFLAQASPVLAWLARGTGTVPALTNAAFFWALAELHLRRGAHTADLECLQRGVLPEDPRVVIDREYVPRILAKLKELPGELRRARLASLVETCALKYQTSDSVGEVASALGMQVDIEFNKLDSSFNPVRYCLWVIPSLGFIGTVQGLSGSLKVMGGVGQDTGVMTEVTRLLAFAFDTTFVSLVFASILMLIYHAVIEKEEGLLNSLSDYCLRNFVVKAHYPEG